MAIPAIHAFRDFRRFRREYKGHLYYRAHFQFAKLHGACEIDSEKVLVQSYDGTSISGNPFYILRELCLNPRYSRLQKYVVAAHASYNDIVACLEKCGLGDVRVVKIHTDEYCRLLASCKYLVNNATFAPYFIKQQGQVYLNTWHGTPLKHLGRRIVDSPEEIANTQRNFLMSDYLLAPNELTLDCFVDDYMLRQHYAGTYLLGGYPRNQVFFDADSRRRVRRELSLGDVNAVAYMPTWRGNLAKKQNAHQFAYVLHTLYELDKVLDDGTVFFVKFHSQAGHVIDYGDFDHIRPFPSGFETYEFLNAMDCLVTDYSSVMFDFANTGRKVVLYAYDRERYFKDKGSYLDFDELPFIVAETVAELGNAMARDTAYPDYSGFMQPLIRRDSALAAERLCRRVFCGEGDAVESIDGKALRNGKPNLLLFAGSLARNGITSALKSLVACADLDDFNLLLTFDCKAVEKSKLTINDFFGVDYLPIRGRVLHTPFEAAVEALYFKYGLRLPGFGGIVERVYRREMERSFPGMDFRLAVHYSGYEKRSLNTFHAFGGRRVVYVHNDMGKEGESKGNFSRVAVLRAYRDFEAVACVRESSKPEVLAFGSGIDADKVRVAHNFLDFKSVREKAALPLLFDADTRCTVDAGRLDAMLDDPHSRVILNIGRFSPEKGQERLIDAFLAARDEMPDAYLVIIGGYGPLHESILQKVAESGCDRIIVCQNISNPYPVLARSDVFFLSSFYEGLPVTIFESFALGVPVISTEIAGPDALLENVYGALVPDSFEGVVQGMRMIARGAPIPHEPYDLEAFNARAQDELRSAWGLDG